MDFSELKIKLQSLRERLLKWQVWLDLDNKKSRIIEMETEILEPNFWKDRQKAETVSKELGRLKSELEDFEKKQQELDELETMFFIADKENQEEAGMKEILPRFEKLEKQVDKEETKTFLSGKYDKGSATL